MWGSVIANGESHGTFEGRDWGYMLVLYILLTLIRVCLFFMAYPITSRIGLKTNLKETLFQVSGPNNMSIQTNRYSSPSLFQVYGGLRGAVGIALAIALDSAVRGQAKEGSEFLEHTNKAFGMIGGIAFLTLVINGTTAGP